MKKYRQISVALLIGLLSFNTLSSCVGTRQAFRGKNLELGSDYTQRYEQDTGICDKLKVIVPFTFLMLWMTVLPWIIIVFRAEDSPLVLHMNDSNSNGPFTTKGVRPFMFDPVR